MTQFTAIVFVFILLLLINPNSKMLLKNKKKEDWILDILSLAIQGIFVPFIQFLMGNYVLSALFPRFAHAIHLSPVCVFLICFLGIDYLYYWNRFLHSGRGWIFHRIHHSVTEMDVVSSSRNSLIGSFFIVYCLANSTVAYIFQHSQAVGLAMGITSILDLWRHSRLYPAQDSNWRMLLWFFINPRNHAYHHAKGSCNFGANFSIWDRIHGTFKEAFDYPTDIAMAKNFSLKKAVMYPFLG